MAEINFELKEVKYILNRKIDSKKRISLPPEISEELNLKGGDTMRILLVNDTIIIKKMPNKEK